jgi:hypothetical protein
MNSVATIVLVLLVVLAVVAFVRMMGGANSVAGPRARPLPPREGVVEREVERPPTQRVVEREVERPQEQDRVVERRVIEREVVPEDPDVL